MSIAGKIGSEVLERAVGFGLADDVAEKVFLKGLASNYLGPAAMSGAAKIARMPEEMPMLSNSNIMAGLDTSKVPGGSVASGLSTDGPRPGLVSAPKSDALQTATMKMRAAQRALDGSPASLLFPDGLVGYLEAANRQYEKPNNITRLKGLLDFL